MDQNETHKALREEIELMASKDQEMRKRFKETGEWDASVDEVNTARAKEILTEAGYPTISKVGEDASHQFWLLIQHADKHPDFQRQCLDMMRALPKEEIDQKDIAYLEDRVRLAEKRPQLYGTQFWENPETGVYGPRPIEDEEHIEERRAQAGLETFEEYKRIMLQKFDPKDK